MSNVNTYLIPWSPKIR